jgi:DNA-directed RNA polymerase subunit RPC12/RpoP
MSYKCSMCQQPISPIDGEWGMQFSLSKWMHYRCIEHLWDVYSSMRKSDFIDDTRVRCTKDGEYPEDDITVLAEFHGVDFADIPHIVWFEWDNAQWVDFLTEEIIPNVPEEMTVYWQPLTSLKEQYEKKKEEV